MNESNEWPIPLEDPIRAAEALLVWGAASASPSVVLLRHRLLPQPHGFETLFSVEINFDAGDFPVREDVHRHAPESRRPAARRTPVCDECSAGMTNTLFE